MITGLFNNMFVKQLLPVCCLMVVFVDAQQPKLMLPIGNTGRVYTASFSPDGNKIITAAQHDNTAKIWDAQNGTLLADLKGHTDQVISVCFSPNGKKIVTASTDNTAKIWDAVSAELLLNLRGHVRNVLGASFSPDNKKVVTASDDHTAKIWNAANGVLLVDLRGHTGWVYSAHFSPDGKRIVTASQDGRAIIWNAINGAPLAVLNRNTKEVTNADFSPDGKWIVTICGSSASIWDAKTGRFLFELKGHTGDIMSANFSKDSKKIVTASRDSIAKIWDAETGLLLHNLAAHTSGITSACFSPDDKKIITSSWDSTAKIWDAEKGILLGNLKGHKNTVFSACFSPNNKNVVTSSRDNTAKIWDAENGALLIELKGHSDVVRSAYFTPDGKKIVTAQDSGTKMWDVMNGMPLPDVKADYNYRLSKDGFSADGKKMVTPTPDGTAKVWDAFSGAVLANLKGHTGIITTACFSPDSKKIVTASTDSTAKIWDAFSGALLANLKGHTGKVNGAYFSPDGRKVVTASSDGTAKVWDAAAGTLLADLKRYNGEVITAFFSPDGKKILSATRYTVTIWDATSDIFLFESNEYANDVNSACFSPDGKKLVTVAAGNTAKIWDIQKGILLFNLTGHTDDITNAYFSPDGKKIVTSSRDNTAKIWNVQNGVLAADLKGHTEEVESACFSPDSKKILTESWDNTAKIWDVDKGSLIYTFFAVDSNDYIIVDNDNRYDGTAGARKLLYYTCGTEVIGLQQLKDKLWVPGLAERINKGEIINAPKLSDLDICGLIPTIKQMENKSGYQFKITPQRGGLGITTLYVNGIETKNFYPSDLKKVPGGFVLFVQKEEVSQYFVAGKENAVSVKSYTKENDISSRGITVLPDVTAKDTTPPNLYAVVIGVSDYKGEDLDLQYAAKDAGDFLNAVSLSAGKLLGKEHVFMYDLTTAEKHYLLPEKKSIKDVFTEIGKKAAANDILLIFFAGHGVVEGDDKQFYFLTADASPNSITATGVKDVGVSAAELMDWMKPATIKAQKRILILDACQSGSAIQHMVTVGNNEGYIAARNDDKAEEIKQIDKLNERSGLYILAASASNQKAYEMEMYNQGLLTYALLKVIKEHPEILEQKKFLNVSNWFSKAVDIVTDIVRENRLSQVPQLITTTSFTIGEVDDDVLSKIILSGEKPFFTESNFQNNDDAVAYDDMEVGRAVNYHLNEVSSGTAITYVINTDSPEAYFLSGRYEVKGDEIIVKVNLRQSKDKLPKYSFQVKGNKDDVSTLGKSIVKTAMEWISSNKK